MAIWGIHISFRGGNSLTSSKMIPNDNGAASAGCLHRGLEEYLHAAADDLTVWESFWRQPFWRRLAFRVWFWVERVKSWKNQVDICESELSWIKKGFGYQDLQKMILCCWNITLILHDNVFDI